MRVVFMGTPELASDILRSLDERFEVVAAFCQPDKPVGRKQILTPPPVKETAEELGIPVYQPKGFKNGKAAQLLREMAPDIIAVCAYGRILPQEVLDIPVYGCVNLHGSLLPEYRGSAPVQRAIMDGAEVTGLTAIMMSAEMDSGDILDKLEIPIGEMDTELMMSKMGEVGGPFFCDVIEKLCSGLIEPAPQDSGKATYAPPIEKSEGDFDFSRKAKDIVNLIRGLSMWPMASFEYEGKKIKVCTASYAETEGEIGEILSLNPLTIAAAEGSVVVGDVIPQGSRRMSGTEWARGRRFKTGDKVFI